MVARGMTHFELTVKFQTLVGTAISPEATLTYSVYVEIVFGRQPRLVCTAGHIMTAADQ
jgi:hypothetical protein